MKITLEFETYSATVPESLTRALLNKRQVTIHTDDNVWRGALTTVSIEANTP